MKKKKVILTVVAALAAAVLLLIAAVGILTLCDRSVSVGRYIESKRGTPIIVVGDRPIRMNDLSDGGDLFSSLETGDLLLVLRTAAIAQIYPAETGTYACLRLGGGDIEDISEAALTQLDEFGWIDYTPTVRDPFEGADKVDFEAQYIRTGRRDDELVFPSVTIITSRSMLDRYYEQNKNRFDLERREKVAGDSTIGFLDAVDKYDEEFFKNKKLVFVLVEEGSGSVRHKVTEVLSLNGKLQVTIRRIVPEIGTDDMAEWHIMVELDRDVKIKNASAVELK